MSDFDDLYRDIILDHNRRPRNRGRLPAANRVATGDNPTCGDNCTVHLRVEGDRIADISFEGSACAISTASTSIMTTRLKGKTAAEAEAAFAEFKGIVTTGAAPDDAPEKAAFAGVHEFPARIKCATLGWHAALEALKQPPSAPK